MVLLEYLSIRQEEQSLSVLNKVVYPDVIRAYGRQRAVDGKGVTIPSQVRYVGYFEKIVRMNLNTVLFMPMLRARISSYPSPKKLRLLEISVVGAPVKDLVLVIISYDSYYAPGGAELLHPDNTSKSGNVLYYNLSDVLQTVTEEKFSDTDERVGPSSRRSKHSAKNRVAANQRQGEPPSPISHGEVSLLSRPKQERSATGTDAPSDHREASKSRGALPRPLHDRQMYDPVREFAHDQAMGKEVRTAEPPSLSTKAGEMTVFNNPLRRRISKPSTIHFHGTIDLQTNVPVRFQNALAALADGTRTDPDDGSATGSIVSVGDHESSFLESNEDRSFSASALQTARGVSPLRPGLLRSQVPALAGIPGGSGQSYAGSALARDLTGRDPPSSVHEQGSGLSRGAGIGYTTQNASSLQGSDPGSSGVGSQAAVSERQQYGSGTHSGTEELSTVTRRWRGVFSRGLPGGAAASKAGTSPRSRATRQSSSASSAPFASYVFSGSLVTLCDEVYIEAYNQRRSKRYFYTHCNTALLEKVVGRLYHFSVPGTQLDEACKRGEWHGCRLSLKCVEI